ncbi:hypothetical protein [Streptomyces sp. NPDC088350]|uniref:hypothetical protein n=1 Tax=Streptomyces sp. NPDC088350 TaxID=3365854 RepID=UPI003821B707
MSEFDPAPTDLKTHYAARVKADLERNTAEQDRINAEMAALQEQLQSLQHDRVLLAGLQQALGGNSPAATGPGPEEKTTAALVAPQQAPAESRPTKGKKAAARKATAKSPGASTATPAAKQPTLVGLIHTHLAQQTEPRSAAEITSALADAHPERDIKPKVVRTTVEGLVAKSRVHRSKQGSSVFYTVLSTEPADAPKEQSEPVTA